MSDINASLSHGNLNRKGKARWIEAATRRCISLLFNTFLPIRQVIQTSHALVCSGRCAPGTFSRRVHSPSRGEAMQPFHPTSFHLNKVRCETTQFVVAATNQNTRAVLSVFVAPVPTCLFTYYTPVHTNPAAVINENKIAQSNLEIGRIATPLGGERTRPMFALDQPRCAAPAANGCCEATQFGVAATNGNSRWRCLI